MADIEKELRDLAHYRTRREEGEKVTNDFMWKVADEIKRLKELEEEAISLKQLFDQQWKRTREAGELWRQAHPGNDLVNPDLGELVRWLMSRADAAEAKLAEAMKVIERLQAALEPFALTSIEGVVKVATGYVTVTTQAEYYHRARAALKGEA